MKIFRWTIGSILLLLTVFLSASEKPVPVLPPMEEEKEEIFYDYDLSQYITLGDISAVEASFEDPALCTDKEIDDAIFQILLSAATFSEKDGKAERYNKVLFDFSIEQNGTVLSDYSQSDYEVVIGMEKNNAIETVLGEEMMGTFPGQVESIPYTYPESMTESPLAGQSVTLKATVKKVYQHFIPELIDSWVQEKFQGEFLSVQEFRESVRLDILKEKEKAKAKAVWLKILEDTRVRSYPKKEVEQYILLYKDSFEEEAKRFEVSLAELVTIYMGQSMEQFSADARLFAEEKVKNEMVFTQLVRLQGTQISPEEYEQGLQMYFEDEKNEFGSLEEFISYYGKENLHRSILWDKALKEVVDRAVCVN